MFFHMVYKSGQIFLPFCHNPRVWRTDGRTDRRTDRILIARPRLHSMQRGKKCFGNANDWPCPFRIWYSSVHHLWEIWTTNSLPWKTCGNLLNHQ